MTTVILAAGEGTRLSPYTIDRPKCMVSLGGRPLLHWQLSCLHHCGMTDPVLVVGGYRMDSIHAPGTLIIENTLFQQTNMVATLMCAREWVRHGEDLIISYGDIVYEPRVLRAVLASDAPLVVAADRQWRRYWSLRMDNPLEDAETFKISDGDNITELGKKPRSYDDIHGQYIGLIKVRGDRTRDFFEHYDRMEPTGVYDGKDFLNMYMTSFLQNLVDSGWQSRACFVDNGWLEIDTAAELELYSRMLDDQSLYAFCDLRKIT